MTRQTGVILALVAVLVWWVMRGTVSAKEGVSLGALAPEGYTILGAIERAARTFGVDLVITSAHRDDDPGQHGAGKAIDLRTIGLRDDQVRDLWSWFRVELGSSFVVLFEVPSATVRPGLASIATVRSAATAEHFHLGART